MEEESGTPIIVGAESLDWTSAQTDDVASLTNSESVMTENDSELLSAETTSAFVIEPLEADSDATNAGNRVGNANGHAGSDDGSSDILYTNSESGLGILLGSVTSLSDQSVEGLSLSSSVCQKPIAPSSTALQQCVVCKRMMKCKFNIIRDGDMKHLCTEVCFKVFRCNPTMYLETRMIPLPTSSSANVYLVSDSNGKSVAMPSSGSGSAKTSTLKCFKCQLPIRSGDVIKFSVAYMGGRAFFCESACFVEFVRVNRLCASCGVSVQGKETAQFVDTPLDKYLYFCTSKCKDTFCNPSPLTSLTNSTPAPVANKADVSHSFRQQPDGPSTSAAADTQVIEIAGDDDDVEIVGVSTVSDFNSVTRVGRLPSISASTAPTASSLINILQKVNPTAKKRGGCSVCGSNVMAPNFTFTCLGKTHSVCGEACLQAFKYANKVNMSSCSQCSRVFVVGEGGVVATAKFENETKSFCSTPCLERYRRQRQKNASCAWCGAKRTNVDMVERVDANGKVQLFCTLKCLSLYRVNLQAMSNVSVPCDQCRRLGPAQYHLTMSDASVRNFCSYDCVISYQSQFSDAATLPKSAATANADGLMPVPVISDVVSMHTGKKKATQRTPAGLTPTSIVAAPGAISRLNNNSQLPSSATLSSVKVAQNEDLAQSNMRQLFIMPPQPRPTVNKSTSCRPVSLTKATTCRPQTTPHFVQTDTDMFQKPVLIPVPVPIFVPVPVPMYTMPTPYPLPIPVPLPVPIFLPTTAKTAATITKHIQDVLESTPSNPYEADILHLAEAIARAESDAPALPEDDVPDTSAAETVLDTMLAMDQDTAAVNGGVEHEMSDEALLTAARIASEVPSELVIDFEEYIDSLPGGDNRVAGPMLRQGKRQMSAGRGGSGAKRTRVDGNGTIVVGDDGDIDLDDGLLKVSIGVNAWRLWVLHKNILIQQQAGRAGVDGSSGGGLINKKAVALGGVGSVKPFNTDPLRCPPDELAIALSMFVKEVRKPTGDEYAPDTVFYFCLCIQQCLYKNGRTDNIFTDPIFEQFSDILNEVMQRYEIRLNMTGDIVARIDEEHLWETKQLGAHSPHTLLATLIYFNTKYFLLKRVEDHQTLAFNDIIKHWKKAPGNLARGSKIYYLRYAPSAIINDPSKGKFDETMLLEQAENLVDGTRCPVKLYEFYLSKCPEAARYRNDMFYLVPERSCIADSPVWYSSQPVSVEVLVKIISRLRVVRELQEIYLHDATL